MNLAHGLIELPWWGYVVVALVFTHITIAAVTIYLHRHQAHRGLDLHPIVSHFFRFWLWLTTGMVTKEWVAIHRKHHAKVETVDDPHSPQTRGLNKVLWEGTELYRQESHNEETMKKYSFGTPDDWIERHLYLPRSQYGIAVMFVANVLLFGPLGITIWAVQMGWIPFFAAGVINGIGHYWGYRNFESDDTSTNVSPWGILIGGEELHNNHHAFPSSAKLSAKPWEFDIGWMYIRIFEIMGLAHVKKVAPRLTYEENKPAVDMETLRAIIVARLHVLADYARNVTIPVWQEEMRQATEGVRAMLEKARSRLIKNMDADDVAAKAELDAALSQSDKLKTVYQFRLRLQELWNRSTVSPERLLGSLQEWCAQAEATGIKALQDFARGMRSYAVATLPAPAAA
jgi:stearoyl-CoA desaturase (Delta-9 desaturase)